ncbi:ATP synthase, F1 complex, epsilon subunit [Campylobacter blaseri]|uniref:ATP synthase epsilon chain n=1 Tax=Campylobacter blaseri TaxID=2042961 RepID=A0A2P8QZC1_9BACT|nr:ATP synthase F1 subunit epsilon [Campylobacter blaseri]PSM51597.1 F0F1 ATP synthase subunit epsilon [Campylobacter blaseri]PSM53390.1 F0F1 ATP synthase subunit epsilon [Campylobacter blaseri]QKF86686.1 ATP synthase, F1 complex, epsilon subunit [Campylobacter blaseri]
MNDKFHLEIVTPTGIVFSDSVKSVQLPGSEGEFGVLPGHAAITTLLSSGLIEIVDLNDEKDIVAISWGYVKVDESKVTVLADGAVYIGGKDNSSIAESMEKAKELIESMGADNVNYANTISRMETHIRVK